MQRMKKGVNSTEWFFFSCGDPWSLFKCIPAGLFYLPLPILSLPYPFFLSSPLPLHVHHFKQHAHTFTRICTHTHTYVLSVYPCRQRQTQRDRGVRWERGKRVRDRVLLFCRTTWTLPPILTTEKGDFHCSFFHILFFLLLPFVPSKKKERQTTKENEPFCDEQLQIQQPDNNKTAAATCHPLHKLHIKQTNSIECNFNWIVGRDPVWHGRWI